MKTLYESIFDVDDNIEKFDKGVFNIPNESEWYMVCRSPREYAIVWECQNLLSKYSISHVSKYSKGISFMISEIQEYDVNKRDYIGTGKYIIKAKFTDDNNKYLRRGDIRGWSCTKYTDKPISYNKKVVMSLIEHLAKNPKSLKAMIDKHNDVYRDISARQSYDDGSPIKVLDFMELMKIKG